MRTGIVTGLKRTIIAATSLATFSLADNPISSYHYLADPSAASDGDTFYILTDTDDMCVSSDPFIYDLIGLYAFSSKDMKNWTDHGLVFRSKREFDTYPSNTWASGIAVKDGKIYIVYPDNSSGVGMITAPSIDGPYTDPIADSYGGTIRQIAGYYRDGSEHNPIIALFNGCDNIAHCFDPGIFFDDDGTGYVIFGGGQNSNRPYGNNFDIVKFTDEDGRVTIDQNSLKRIEAPNSFEAPYLHKYMGKYYLSFNNEDQIIDYSISDTITGPYSYVGDVIPSIYGVTLYGDRHIGGNNHQGFAEFKKNHKWYAVYHDRRLVASPEHPRSCSTAEGCVDDPEPGNHRSVSIDELSWYYDENAKAYKMSRVQFTDDGPAQVGYFDPYQTYKAITSSKQRNIRSRTDWTKGQPVKHVLTPLASKESWIRVSGVDFGSGATSFIVKAASLASGNSIEIRSGAPDGTLAGTCVLPQTGDNVQDETGWRNYETTECSVTGLSDIVEQLFLVFKGSQDSTMGILEWEFTNGPAVPQKPFNATNTPWTIPGKIQAEDFDVPGKGSNGNSYKDSDPDKNQGGSTYRDGIGVDIKDLANGGHAIGWNANNDWLEYTINVSETGDYTLYAAVSGEGGRMVFTLDGNQIGDTINVSKDDAVNDDEEIVDSVLYGDFYKVKTNVRLESGEHILRMTVAQEWFDLDYINFVKGENAPDDSPIGNVDESSSSTASNPSSSSSENSSSSTHPSSGSAENPGSSAGSEDHNEGNEISDASTEAIIGIAEPGLSAAKKVYKLYTLKGELIRQSKGTPVSTKGLNKGIYLLQEQNGASKTAKMVQIR